MPIPIEEIKECHLYEAGKGHHRVVLGIEDDKVVYVACGKVLNFQKASRIKSSLERFANACHKDLGPVRKDEFERIKKEANY